MKCIRMKSATISTVAKSISHADWGWTDGDLAEANAAWISTTQPIRYSFDGVTHPTTTLGHYIEGTWSLDMDRAGDLVRALDFIRAGAADALVTVSLLVR